MQRTAPIEVIYTDNHLYCINKPAGLLSQADRTGDPDVLSLGKADIAARFKKPGAVFLGLVSRLDRPVSGVMLLARTSKAAARLSALFAAGDVQKSYLAIVEGRCKGTGVLRHHLQKARQQVTISGSEAPGAKYAELHWQCLDAAAGYSLLLVMPKTGRPHQIRVQLAHMGHPIIGDTRYGACEAQRKGLLGLHSWKLVVKHPTRPELLTFQAPPPASWQGWFEQKLAEMKTTATPFQSEMLPVSA